jgi:hypothetical protein
VGAAGVQSPSPQGAELLPDHGLRGAERAGAARAESAGRHPRREGRPPVSARAAPPGAGDARPRLRARISHGWSLFPARCPGAAGGGRGGIRDQGAILPMGRAAEVRQTRTWTRVTARVLRQRGGGGDLGRAVLPRRGLSDETAKNFQPISSTSDALRVQRRRTRRSAGHPGPSWRARTHEKVYGELRAAPSRACPPCSTRPTARGSPRLSLQPRRASSSRRRPSAVPPQALGAGSPSRRSTRCARSASSGPCVPGAPSVGAAPASRCFRRLDRLLAADFKASASKVFGLPSPQFLEAACSRPVQRADRIAADVDPLVADRLALHLPRAVAGGSSSTEVLQPSAGAPRPHRLFSKRA